MKLRMRGSLQMLLTTEPTISGQRYTVLRVISGAGIRSGMRDPAYLLDVAIGDALAMLETKAHQIGADAVIGVHVSTSMTSLELGMGYSATVMGTAIKFIDRRVNSDDWPEMLSVSIDGVG